MVELGVEKFLVACCGGLEDEAVEYCRVPAGPDFGLEPAAMVGRILLLDAISQPASAAFSANLPTISAFGELPWPIGMGNLNLMYQSEQTFIVLKEHIKNT